MRILIVGDVHFCSYSSILRSRGAKYSTRIEKLLESLDWVERLAEERDVDEEVYLGDFMDRSDVSAEEITALRDIGWSEKPKTFIVGNHESNVSSLFFNSTNALGRWHVASKPEYVGSKGIVFLPYVTEDERKPLQAYFDELGVDGKPIVFSHNDIKDMQVGAFVSKIGFSISEIGETCAMFVNGHIHNGGWVSPNLLNLGNLTGQNFGEDAFRYGHRVAILDTETMGFEFFDNPHAMNFYKITVTDGASLGTLSGLKNNAVLSVKCPESMVREARSALDSAGDSILAYKIVCVPDQTTGQGTEGEPSIGVDHLQRFRDYVVETLGHGDVVMHELSEVLGQ